MKHESTERQLQLWDAKTRTYMPTGNTVDSAVFKAVEALADTARLVSKAWRIVDGTRPTKNPKHHPPRGNSLTAVEDIQRAYLLWAQAKGLTSIVAYNNRPPPNFAADRLAGYHKKRADKSVPLFTGEIRYITPEMQFAVDETCELEQAA